MEEKRLSNRFYTSEEISGQLELDTEVNGGFHNHESFTIKDISLGGINILSSFCPKIGDRYSAYIDYDGKEYELPLQIAYSRIHSFLDAKKGIFKAGPLYSIGCEIVYSSEKQRELILQIIRSECKIPKSIPEESD